MLSVDFDDIVAMLSVDPDDIVAMLSIEPETIVSADAARRQLPQRPAGASAASGRPQRGQEVIVISMSGPGRTTLHPPHHEDLSEARRECREGSDDRHPHGLGQTETVLGEPQHGADAGSHDRNDQDGQENIPHRYTFTHRLSPRWNKKNGGGKVTG
jgi:hypothetical protein